MNLRRIAFLAALAAGLATPTLAQQPTQAQIGVIRQSCRSDFLANCSGVPTGGQAALACLKEHAASLSPGCQEEVGAIAPAPHSEAPAAVPPPAHAAAPAHERELIHEACGPDYRTLCRGTRPGGGRVVACFADHKESLSPPCAQAMNALERR